MTMKIVEGRVGTRKKLLVVRDVEEHIRGRYTNVHVAAMDYGGNRDFSRDYLKWMQQIQKRAGGIRMTHSVVGVSPAYSPTPEVPYRELFDPDKTYDLKAVQPWGPSIPRDASNLLYVVWEDQTGATGHSARSGPIGLAHFIGEERIPKGKIMLAVEVDGGGQRKEGFAHFAALRLYPPQNYVGFVKHLEKEAARTPYMKAVLNELEKKGLLDLFEERSTPPPEWSFAEEYKNRPDTMPDNVLSLFAIWDRMRRDPVQSDVRQLLKGKVTRR